jgi:phage/plasmid-associated DNA primase
MAHHPDIVAFFTGLPDDFRTSTDDQLTQWIESLHGLLQGVTTVDHYHRLNYHLFDDPSASSLIEHYLSVFEKWNLRIGDVSDVKERSELRCKTRDCRTIIWLGYESFLTLERQRRVMHDGISLDGKRTLDILSAPIDESQLKRHQVLIRSYLYRCYLKGYRRRGTGLYSPFIVNGVFTHSFVLDCEIKDFVYAQCGTDFAVFSVLTDLNNMPKRIIKYLEECHETALPEYKTKRDLFSFQNGVYNAELNTFYPYVSISSTAPWAPFASAKYHDFFFDEALYSSLQDPMDIPTPSIDCILDTQNFSPSVRRIIFAILGRLVFDVDQLDSFQFVPFFKGVAGSGKSTLILLVRNFYMETDCGSLESEHASKTFPLEHLYGKYFYSCIDVSPNHALACTTFFTMTSGEPMAINIKYQSPVQGAWKVPGAFAGNSYPPWTDVGGNVSRRFVTVLFDTPVLASDNGLKAKCLQEVAPFMKKCVTAYHNLRQTMLDTKRNGIYTQGVLPAYFHDTKRAMLESMNPMCAFITSDDCEIGDQYATPFLQFRTQYMEYCKQNRIASMRVTKDTLSNVCHLYGITCQTNAANKIVLIKGVRLVAKT